MKPGNIRPECQAINDMLNEYSGFTQRFRLKNSDSVIV